MRHPEGSEAKSVEEGKKLFSAGLSELPSGETRPPERSSLPSLPTDMRGSDSFSATRKLEVVIEVNT